MMAAKGQWKDIKPKKVLIKKLSRAEKLAEEQKKGEDFLTKAIAADEASRKLKSSNSLKIGAALKTIRTNQSLREEIEKREAYGE